MHFYRCLGIRWLLTQTFVIPSTVTVEGRTEFRLFVRGGLGKIQHRRFKQNKSLHKLFYLDTCM